MDAEKKENAGRSQNPAIAHVRKKNVALETGKAATAKGAFTKAVLMLAGLFIASGATCFLTISPRTLFLLVFAAFGVSIVICMKPQYTASLAAPYVVMEGMLLGQIATIQERLHPGVSVQTLLITLVIAALVALSYRFQWVMVNELFKSRVFLVTFGIATVYAIDLVLLIGFDKNVPMIHESDWKGILASLFVIYVAAMNLVWDFDDICVLTEKGMPKYYEWFFAFSLVVTLIWLYVEVTQLIRKILRIV
ncbi:MAG: Bax inhibitor-1/YccA family protein [Acidaminococcaceae bacterium]|nr:Bax inhibitor-1/YccA family protein [Acidaminococcaceae bacterium]